MIFLLNLVPALRVKDVAIFDLLEQEFHYGEFIFFSQLAAHLGRIANISAKDAKEVGLLSELIYLSSKIHFFVAEKTDERTQCSALQMPVLIGDLLYSRFVVFLSEFGKVAYLPIYLEYLRQFNQQRIEDLQKQQDTVHTEYIVRLLSQKTAAVVASIAGGNGEMQNTLQTAAENFWQEQWALLYGKRVTSLADLEEQMLAAVI